jgi:transposase-like protein
MEEKEIIRLLLTRYGSIEEWCRMHNCTKQGFYKALKWKSVGGSRGFKGRIYPAALNEAEEIQDSQRR